MEQNVHKTKTVRNLGKVDLKPLMSVLMLAQKHWDQTNDFEINKNKRASLKQVNHVNFRWSNKKDEPPTYYDLPLWDSVKHLLLPVMQTAVKPIGYKEGYFPRVMLAKMISGTSIPEHIDGKTRGWIPHKIHIPIVTNTSAKFYVDGIEYHFEAGVAYEVNNAAMHGAKNEGETVRIHLIFEYLDGDINNVPSNDLITA